MLLDTAHVHNATSPAINAAEPFSNAPEDYVRRHLSPESPTLDLMHLLFEATLTAARESTNPFDFARVPAGTTRTADL